MKMWYDLLTTILNCIILGEVSEKLARWVQLLNDDAGVSKLLRVSVGVHQGRSLSPLLFLLVMDSILEPRIVDAFSSDGILEIMSHGL